jgi:HAD superfamily phosphoserine phosphatase-like hydrolase
VEALGVAVWIVSASPQIVVEAVLAHYGIRAAGIIGVRNVVRAGVITDQLEEPLSIYEGKVARIKVEISPLVRPLIAVGDSMNDAPMLWYGGRNIPVVVDRGNALADEARKNGWHLIR